MKLFKFFFSTSMNRFRAFLCLGVIVLHSFVFILASRCFDNCNYHGICDRGFCVCDEKYFGPTCALKRCPRYNSWVAKPFGDVEELLNRPVMECSNQGICNRNTVGSFFRKVVHSVTFPVTCL
jgi:hypothetical protein